MSDSRLINLKRFFILVFLLITLSVLVLHALGNESTPYLFSDTFSDGNFDEWTVVDASGASAGPSDWSVVQAYGSLSLRQNSDIYAPTNDEGTYAYTGDSNWSDYHINVDVYAEDNDSIFVMFRYVDDDNYYRFIMNKQSKFQRLEVKQGGVYTTLAENNTFGYGSDWLNIQIKVLGNNIEVFYEYEKIFDLNDFILANGEVAIGTSGSTGVHFDNFIVTPSGIDPYADALIAYNIFPTPENHHGDPVDILGPTRRKTTEYEEDFVSFGGPSYFVVLDMGANEEIIDGDGNDFRVYEVGQALGGTDEEYDVFASNSPSGPWTFVDRGLAVSEFDLDGTGLAEARYLRIEDQSIATNGTHAPGSDIDAVQALNMVTQLCLMPPSLVFYELIGNDIHLSWLEVAGSIGYNVYTGSISSVSRLSKNLITMTEFTQEDGALFFNGNYFFITSVSATGCESSFSMAVPTYLFLPFVIKP